MDSIHKKRYIWLSRRGHRIFLTNSAAQSGHNDTAPGSSTGGMNGQKKPMTKWNPGSREWEDEQEPIYRRETKNE